MSGGSALIVIDIKGSVNGLYLTGAPGFHQHSDDNRRDIIDELPGGRGGSDTWDRQSLGLIIVEADDTPQALNLARRGVTGIFAVLWGRSAGDVHRHSDLVEIFKFCR